MFSATSNEPVALDQVDAVASVTVIVKVKVLGVASSSVTSISTVYTLELAADPGVS